MLTRQEVTELCEFDSAGAPVLSFYLNFDKQRTDDDYAIRAKNLLRRADEQADTLDTNCSVHTDVNRIRGYLTDRHDRSARGLAVFASGPAGLWSVHELSQPVESRVELGYRPQIRPLIRLFDTAPDHIGLIISRDRGRIFSIRQGEMRELETPEGPDVPGQHSQGGWSQANYQRHIEDHVRAHFETVAARLLDLFQSRPYRYLIVAGPIEVTSAFIERLHPYVRARLAGATHLGIDAGVAEIAPIFRGVLQTRAASERSQLLDKLGGGTGDAERSVAGLSATNEVLQQGQVQTLLVDDMLVLAGARCAQCGYVTQESDGQCPYCLIELTACPNIIDPLVESAFLQEARIAHCIERTERERLTQIGSGIGIGALLRYALPTTES